MKTVPAVPRLVRMGSRPPAGLGLYRAPSPTVRDANGRVWPKLDVTKPHYDGSPCGDHCLPQVTPDGPMRWLNEPDPTRPPPLLFPRPPQAALRGYQRWTCPNGDSVVIPAIPPRGMGGIQRWACPSGADPRARCATSRGLNGCAPCGGLAGGCGGGCGGKCPCQPPSMGSPTTLVGPGTLTSRGYAPSARGIGNL